MPVSSTSVLVILNAVLESTRVCLEDNGITLDLGSFQTISLATIDSVEEKQTLSNTEKPLLAETVASAEVIAKDAKKLNG